MKYFNKNGVELKDGDIFDIHQTVNGRNLFLAVTVEPLDIEYAEIPGYKYEYDKEDLLAVCPTEGVAEFEIVGNIKTLPLSLSISTKITESKNKLTTIVKQNILDKASIAVYAYEDDSSTMYLANLQVHQRLRHQGLGREMLTQGEKFAAENGATSVDLLALEKAWMHKWYARCGYVDLKKDNSGYVWMTKKLN